MNLRLLALCVLLLALNSTIVCAGENIEDDLSGFSENISDDLSGFAEEESYVETDNTVAISQYKDLSLSGKIAFKTSAGYQEHEVDGVDYSGLNQAQTSLYLQYDEKINDAWKIRISGDAFYDAVYDIRSDEGYRQEALDDYRTQLRLDDSYIQGRIKHNLDLKAGRQIVIWGKSDNIRVTDIINPLDNRLPGMTDIEDLRLSVGMLKSDLYVSQWNFCAMVIPENRIMREATPRGEFFPVDKVFSTAPDPFLPLNAPSFAWDDMQYALAANGVFSGWDLSFYAADVLDQRWHFDKVQGSAPVNTLNRVVTKIKMLGSAVNLVSGSWLLKAEAALLNGVKYNTTADEKNRLDILLGLEYRGVTDTVLSLEVANRHVFDHEQQMLAQADYTDKNEVQSALRLSRSFANDTLNATALLSMFGIGGENGGFSRVWIEYDILDAVKLNLGVVDYIGGEKPFFEAIKDNDRVFADISYSF